MNSTMPPLYLNSVRLASPVLESVARSSVSVMDEAAIQEGHLAQTLRQCVEVIFSRGEDGTVGQEVDTCAPLLGGSGFLELAGGLAFGVSLLPCETIAPDFEIEFFAERVDAAHADAVQSARNFVSRGIELTAGVQGGHDDLRSGNFFAVDIHVVDRNAAAVIDDGDGVVEMDGNFDLIGEAGERFVDRVIDDFIDEVMQA